MSCWPNEPQFHCSPTSCSLHNPSGETFSPDHPLPFCGIAYICVKLSGWRSRKKTALGDSTLRNALAQRWQSNYQAYEHYQGRFKMQWILWSQVNGPKCDSIESKHFIQNINERNQPCLDVMSHFHLTTHPAHTVIFNGLLSAGFDTPPLNGVVHL